MRIEGQNQRPESPAARLGQRRFDHRAVPEVHAVEITDDDQRILAWFDCFRGAHTSFHDPAFLLHAQCRVASM
jgi:hypothetical protein